MEVLTAFFFLCIGLLMRLAVPIAVTLVLVYFLRKLDARWQMEANHELQSTPKLECWKIRGCSPDERKDCIAVSSPLPCWQVFRLPNGYLSEACISCKVFIDAPLPALRSAVSTSKLEG